MTDTTEARPRAAFHAMTEGTKEDWDKIALGAIELAAGLPDRVLVQLRQLGGDYGGFAVDRLEHSLQTATRAHRAGDQHGRDQERRHSVVPSSVTSVGIGRWASLEPTSRPANARPRPATSEVPRNAAASPTSPSRPRMTRATIAADSVVNEPSTPEPTPALSHAGVDGRVHRPPASYPSAKAPTRSTW